MPWSGLTFTLLVAALPDIAASFNVSRSIANLSVAFYALSMAIIPLWWSVLSELYGRRPVYLASLLLFLVWNSVAAVSDSIAMFIVMRCLAGGASASVAAVGAGTIADLWEVERRGRAMGYFFLGPMLGPLVSPVLGGIITDRFGWRSTQWAAVIYGSLVWLLIMCLLPETSAKQLAPTNNSDNEETRLQLSITAPTLSVCQILMEPFYVTRYLRFPPLLMTSYYASVTFATYYVLNITIQSVFSRQPYSFRASILGLMYVPGALGSIMASVLGGRWTDYIMRRQAKASTTREASRDVPLRPMDRMRENAWLASSIYPAALLAYGWTTKEHVFWFVPVSFLTAGLGRAI